MPASSSPPTPKRTGQFVVLVGVTGLFVAFLVRHGYLTHRQSQAISALQDAGATVYFDYHAENLRKPPFVPEWLLDLTGRSAFASVVAVHFHYDAPSDDTIHTYLNDLPGLQSLVMHGNGVTDRTATLLSRIDTLTSVNLTDTSVTATGLQKLSKCRKIRTLTLSGARIEREMIAALHDWLSLRYLQLRAKISPEAFEAIGQIDTLQHLDLLGSRDVGDKEVEELIPLNLRSFFVTGSSITDAGLKKLAKWKSLQSLVISGAAITDNGMGNLREYPELETISLQGTAIRDPSALADLPRLAFVDLSGTQIDDQSVEVLSKSQSIKSLTLHKTRLTDQSMITLAKLRTLTDLTVGPNITETAARQLQRTLPGCTITGYSESGAGDFYLLPTKSQAGPN